MLLIRIFVSLLLITQLTGMAGAQQQEAQQHRVPDDVVQFLGKTARDNLPKARLDDGSYVPQETPEERAQPLISMDDKRRVIERGILTMTMEVCGLNWQPDYKAFMDSERQKYQRSDKAMAYVGLLHGVSMGFFAKSLHAKGCDPTLKANLQKLQKTPPTKRMSIASPAVKTWNKHTRLGHQHSALGDVAAAEKEYRTALKAVEKTQPNTFEVAASLNNLAGVHRERGETDKALKLYVRSKAIMDKVAPEHPSMPSLLNNMAALYFTEQRFSESAALYVRSLEVTKVTVGSEHTSYLTTMSNLAEVYRNQGNYDEAATYSEQSLTLAKKLFKADHPVVAQASNNLAVVYVNQNKFAEAEPLLTHALSVSEKKYGLDSPKLAEPLNNLAFVYAQQGKMDEAEVTLIRALTIITQALGADHPTVKTIQDNLDEFQRRKNP